jgi:hypothetical protein
LNEPDNDEKNKSTNIDPSLLIKGLTVKEIKAYFPLLYSELIDQKGLDIHSDEVQEALIDAGLKEKTENNNDSYVKEDSEKPKFEKDYLQGFNPQAIDFLRRATSLNEANEVITYLEKRGELTKEEAELIQIELENKGLDAFIEKAGGFKDHGFYFKYQQKKKLEEKMKLSKKINL